MSKRHNPWFLAILLLFCGAVWGQDNSGQQPASTAPDASAQQPVPAYGPDNQAAPSVSENPPISGLDLPNLQPHAAPLSYLQPGVHVSESVDSNIENSLGGSEANSITRAEGSLELQRLWSHYALSLDYLGGVGYYNVRGLGLEQVQELGFYQKVSWKRGELGVRDAFSYQPEGAFGSAYGAVGASGAGLGGVGVFFGGSALGSLGQVPRIMNLSLVDAVESLSPKSSLTATVGYGFVHFLENEPGTTSSAGTSTPFIGDSQVSGELGYSRILGPHDQGGVVYGYQGFQFSTGLTFHANLIQLLWGHRISGRMDFLVGAGPQFTEINHLLTPVSSLPSPPTGCVPPSAPTECPTNDLRINASGRARLRYQFPKVSLYASYEQFLTSGSGFFAGAETDIASLGATRPLGRIWSLSTDLGYSRNSRVTPETCSTQNCPGVSANVYHYGFAGVSLHRMFGRNFHVFASYQFNELFFDSSFCTACNRTSERQIGTIGLDWIPRPTRLD
ncbi:MAG: hypothetical protein WB714_23465 [Candidatus Sulfotelmatobacter sp.]